MPIKLSEEILGLPGKTGQRSGIKLDEETQALASESKTPSPIFYEPDKKNTLKRILGSFIGSAGPQQMTLGATALEQTPKILPIVSAAIPTMRPVSDFASKVMEAVGAQKAISGLSKKIKDFADVSRETLVPKDQTFPEKIVSGLGSAVGFAPLGAAGGLAGKAAGASPAVFGSVVAAIGESELEAQEAEKRAIAKGMTEAEAKTAKTKAFWANFPFIAATNIPGFMGRMLKGQFGKTAKEAAEGMIKSGAKSILPEAGQEFYQSIVGDVAVKDKVNLKDAAEQGLIGGIVGGLFGGAAGAQNKAETIQEIKDLATAAKTRNKALLNKRAELQLPEDLKPKDDIVRDEKGEPVTIGKPEEEVVEYKPKNLIKASLAMRAHQGTSFSPEKRGQAEMNSFVSELQNIYDELKPLAKTPQQKKLLVEEMQRFEGSFAAKKNELLSSHSGIVSSMIAGPSNFPKARMEKKNNAYQNKLESMLEWKERAVNSIRRSLKEQKIADAGGEVAYQKQKIANAEEWQVVMKKVNSIVRKNIPAEQKIADIQKVHPKLTEEHAKKLLEPDYLNRYGFPDFELTNNNARIKQMKMRLAQMERKEATPTSEIQAGDIKIVDNAGIDRVQIIYPGKPSDEVRTSLKSKGFRWSPENKAWQRKRTPQALKDAKGLVGLEKPYTAQDALAEMKAQDLERSPSIEPEVSVEAEQKANEGAERVKRVNEAIAKQKEKAFQETEANKLLDRALGYIPGLDKEKVLEKAKIIASWKDNVIDSAVMAEAIDKVRPDNIPAIPVEGNIEEMDMPQFEKIAGKVSDWYASLTPEQRGTPEAKKIGDKLYDLDRWQSYLVNKNPDAGDMQRYKEENPSIREGIPEKITVYLTGLDFDGGEIGVMLNKKAWEEYYGDRFGIPENAAFELPSKYLQTGPDAQHFSITEDDMEKGEIVDFYKVKKAADEYRRAAQPTEEEFMQHFVDLIKKFKEKSEVKELERMAEVKEPTKPLEGFFEELAKTEKLIMEGDDANFAMYNDNVYLNDKVFPNARRALLDYAKKNNTDLPTMWEKARKEKLSPKEGGGITALERIGLEPSEEETEEEVKEPEGNEQDESEVAPEQVIENLKANLKQWETVSDSNPEKASSIAYYKAEIEKLQGKQEAPSEEVEYKGEKMSLAKYKKLRKAEKLAEEGKMNFIKQPPKEPPEAPPASPEEEGEEGWETPQGKREPGKKMPIEDQADLELFTVEQGQGLHPLENVMKGYKIKLSDKNKADWEGVAKRFIDNKKGIAPDAAASEIYNSNPGLLAEPTEEALKEALLKLGDKPIKYGLSKEVQAYLKSKGAAEEVSKRIEEKYGKKLSEEQIRKIAYSYSGLRRSITPYLDVARIGYQAGKKEGRAVEKKIQMTKREAAIDRLKKAFEWKMDKLASKELEKRAIESAIDRDRLERTKEYYEEVDKAKKAIIEYAIEKLPKEARGKLLVAVRDARTAEAASRAFRKIDDEVRRIERRAVLSEIKALLKYVSNTSAIAVDYKEAINEMAEAVDLVKRKPETLDRLRKTLEYMENAKAKGKDVYMPERVLKQLKILFRKPIDQLSTAELRNMLAEIKDIAEAGAMKQKIKDEQYKIRRERIADELINGTQPIEQKVIRGRIKGDPQSKLTLKDKLCNIVARSFNTLQHIDVSLSFMDVLMDYLDGGKGTFDGANFRGHQMLKSDYTEYLKAKQPFITSILAKLKDLKLNDDNLMRVRYWQDLKQKDGKQYLLESGIPEEFLEKLEKEGLTKEEKELYDHMREIYEEIYPMLKDVMKRVYNKEVGYVQNYANFILDMDNVDDLLLEERFGDYAEYARRKNVNANMTKKRTGKAAPLKLHNAVDRMVAYLDNALYLVHMAEDIRTLQEIVKSPEYKEAAGKVGQSAWVDYLDVAARRGGWNNANKVKALDILRKYASASVMGYKLSVAMLQPSALFDGIMFIGDYAPAGFMDICTNKEMRKFAYDNMPELRDRVGDDRALLDVTDDSFLDKFIQSGYVPMRKLDSITAAGVALGAYKKYLKEHNIAFDINNPNKEAIRYAQDIMNRSQSSANFLDIPLALSRGKLTGNLSVDRAILQFQSFILREYNNIDKLALRAYMRGGRGGGDKDIKKGVSMIFWLLIATAFAEIARRGSSALVGQLFGRREYDFKDEYFSGMARELASKIPFVGNQMSVALYNGGIVPSVRILEAPVTGATRMIAGKKPETKAKGALEMVSVMPGGVQIADIGKRVIERLSGSEAKSAALRQFEEYIKGGMKDEELYKEARRNAIKAQVLVKDVKTNALKNVKKEVKDKIEAGILADNENVIREGIRLGRKYGFDKEELAGMMEDVENRIEKREEKKKKIKLQLE